MKSHLHNNPYFLTSSEERSQAFLMQKMNISLKEIEEIILQYGVNAAQLIELMQFSKYAFTHDEKIDALCAPCQLPDKNRLLGYPPIQE